MKKGVLLLFLCSCTVIKPDWFSDLKKGAEKTFKKVEKEVDKTVNTVKKGFENPDRVAIDGAKEAVKSIGVNVNGIERSIDSLKKSVDTIKSDVDTIKASVDAPTSPVTKAPIIANKLQKFQSQATALIKTMDIVNIKTALADPRSLLNVIGNLVSPSTQTDIRNLYGSYDEIITEVDSIDIKPIVASMETTFRDVAATIDTAMGIFTYMGEPGKVAQGVIGSAILDSVRSITSDLRAIANDLDLIKRGGLLNVRSVQFNFAGSLIGNLGTLMPLIAGMQKKPSEISKKVSTIMPTVTKMKNELGSLQATGMGIESRLKQLMENKIKTIEGIFDVPRAAIQELETIIKSMRANINTIMLYATDIVATIAEVLDSGIAGMSEVENAIKFDLLPAESRNGAQALPGDVSKLSRSIDRLRIAIKNK